ncbi:hypothetical protein Tco_0542507 [Tanacetum coccineum]
MVMSKMPIKPVGLTGNMFLSLKKPVGLAFQVYMRLTGVYSLSGSGDFFHKVILLGRTDLRYSQLAAWFYSGTTLRKGYKSCWTSIIREMDSLSKHGINLEKSGEFSVASIRKLIDDKTLPRSDYITRWNKSVPIKIRSYVLTVKWAWKPRVIYFSRVEWLVMYLNLLLAGGMCPLKIATLMTNGLSGLIPCDCLRRTSRCWKAFFISLGGSFGGSETTRSSKIPLQRRCYFLTSYNVNHFFGVVIGVTICSVGTIG